jgi:secondary thiamine-phosphate synthase enzyme
MTQSIIEVPTPRHQSMVEITRDVGALIRQQGIEDGVVHVFTRHTTCGLFINENADPDVVYDLLLRLENLVPWHDPEDRHAEGNTAAHLRSILVGCSVSIPVRDGRMQLGTWQGIFLAEFDGPRRRQVMLTPLPA